MLRRRIAVHVGYISINVGYLSVNVRYLSVNDGYLSVNDGYLSVNVGYLSVQVDDLSVRIGYLSVNVCCPGLMLGKPPERPLADNRDSSAKKSMIRGKVHTLAPQQFSRRRS